MGRSASPWTIQTGHGIILMVNWRPALSGRPKTMIAGFSGALEGVTENGPTHAERVASPRETRFPQEAAPKGKFWRQAE